MLEVPPPPQIDFLSSGAQPLPEQPQSRTAAYPLDAHHRGLHSLLGVVQTNHFGAALIKTQDSSYSVRVGEPIRQSNFTLAELDRDRVILTDGQRKLVVNVGETF
jgi:Tfp pilus assembly protein PilP